MQSYIFWDVGSEESRHDSHTDVSPDRAAVRSWYPLSGLTVHPGSFRRQMTWMRRLGYQGLSMRDLLPYLRGSKRGKVFGITFDDGYVNVLENALPVLKELGFTSTNYFVANRFGGSNEWDRENGVPASALMSQEQARAWVRGGQEAGS